MYVAITNTGTNTEGPSDTPFVCVHTSLSCPSNCPSDHLSVYQSMTDGRTERILFIRRDVRRTVGRIYGLHLCWNRVQKKNNVRFIQPLEGATWCRVYLDKSDIAWNSRKINNSFVVWRFSLNKKSNFLQRFQSDSLLPCLSYVFRHTASPLCMTLIVWLSFVFAADFLLARSQRSQQLLLIVI